MPILRLIKLILLLAAVSFAVGCGSSDDHYTNFQSFQNFDAPVRLRFQTVPQRAAGSVFPTINVAVIDFNGRVVTTDGRPITVSLAEPNGGATLSGTRTQSAVNGVASFNDLSVDLVGEYTLVAEADGLIAAESARFTITSGEANSIVFLQGPPPAPAPGSTPDDLNSTNSVTVGQPFASPIRVEVRDAAGNLVTNSVTVQLRVVRDTVGGVTVSNAVAVTQNGVAIFPDFTIDSGGGAMVLAAVINADTFVTSEPFVVAAPFSLYTASFVPSVLLRVDGVPAAQPVPPPIGGPIVPATEAVSGMAALGNGQLLITAGAFATNTTNPYLADLDLTTGVATPIGPLVMNTASLATDLTVDPSTGTLYTYILDRSTMMGQLHTIDPTSGAATPVGASVLDLQVVALAFDVFDENGPVLYGIEGSIGAVFDDAGYVTFDLTTGDVTEVPGAVAFPAQKCQSLSVVPFNPNLLVGIFQTGNADFELRTIDKATGATVGTPITGFLASLALAFRFP